MGILWYFEGLVSCSDFPSVHRKRSGGEYLIDKEAPVEVGRLSRAASCVVEGGMDISGTPTLPLLTGTTSSTRPPGLGRIPTILSWLKKTVKNVWTIM